MNSARISYNVFLTFSPLNFSPHPTVSPPIFLPPNFEAVFALLSLTSPVCAAQLVLGLGPTLECGGPTPHG